MNFTVVSHVVYLAVTVPLTIWVATELTRNGKVFLADVFAGKDDLASSINKLLVVGFYLLNLGFVMLYLRTGGHVADAEGVFNSASVKVGVVLLTLGVLHFFNVYLFSRLRRRQAQGHQRPQMSMPPLVPIYGPLPGHPVPPPPAPRP